MVLVKCNSTNPICYSTNLICYSTNPICYSTNPICYSTNPICYSTNPICYSTNPICYSTNLLWSCYSTDPICHSTDPICYSTNSTCYFTNPICYSTNLLWLCYSTDPSCYSTDPICYATNPGSWKKKLKIWFDAVCFSLLSCVVWAVYYTRSHSLAHVGRWVVHASDVVVRPFHPDHAECHRAPCVSPCERHVAPNMTSPWTLMKALFGCMRLSRGHMIFAPCDVLQTGYRELTMLPTMHCFLSPTADNTNLRIWYPLAIYVEISI